MTFERKTACRISHLLECTLKMYFKEHTKDPGNEGKEKIYKNAFSKDTKRKIEIATS